ncbi:MAG: YeeE/YedE family protein [Leptospiraceae bacterium]|nr:YeeE/YedE family protein [Leptospiraceae bacterium]
MIKNLIIVFLGVLFAIGLGVSKMTNPSKVIGFLDVTGNWDPSLAFVMAGAMTVYLIGYKLLFPKLSKPILAFRFYLPTLIHIDKKLIIGSLLFGIGWGLAGFCPGPGLVALASSHLEAIYFVISMILGVAIYHWLSEEYSDMMDG